MERDENGNRVLVFATRRHIELLCESPIWFLDGTFKVSPTIFTQLFTILGIRKHNTAAGEPVPLPLMYTLLSGKTTNLYTSVLRAVQRAVSDFHVNACVPQQLIADFELSIINACAEGYPAIPVSC